MGGEVAFTLFRCANVGEDCGKELHIHFAGTHELDWRNANALLRDFTAGAHGTWIHSADVGVMGTVGDVEGGAGATGEEHRRDHGDVGQVRAATIRIVEQRNIAGREAEVSENSSDRHGHGTEVDGHVVAHGDELAPPPPRRRPV